MPSNMVGGKVGKYRSGISRKMILSMFVGNIFLVSLSCTHAPAKKVDPLESNVYTEGTQSLSTSSIFRKVFSVSKPACLLRCRRSKDCDKVWVCVSLFEEINS